MSRAISWIQPEDLVSYELLQRSEEGLDISAYSLRWEKTQQTGGDATQIRTAAADLLKELSLLESPATIVRNEPSELVDILKLCPEVSPVSESRLPDSELLFERIHGGWLGRAAGCMLGKPVEKTSREGIRELLTANQTWPLTDYITARGLSQELLQKYPWNRHGGRESLRENIVCMAEDDDLNYPLINLHVLENCGEHFATEDIAEAWLSLMPVLRCFTAERVAYINTLQLLRPPQTALVNNPYREWIGAQIRADMWGWISPGNPRRAATMAWRDARLSHVSNGIYGEMFFAAVIAAAFHHDEPLILLQEGLRHIPPASRLADAIRFVISLYKREKDFESAVDSIYQRFGNYHWVHTINNAALVAAALLYGEGDFESAVCKVVMGGWDTDSNGATVGSIMGTILGAQGLPKKWVAPLNNRLRSSMKGFDNSAISELAQRTFERVNSTQ